MGSVVMGTRPGHCKVMFKPKEIFQPNSENSGPMQFGYLQARSCCKEENRLQGPKGSVRAMNLMPMVLIPEKMVVSWTGIVTVEVMKNG